MGGGSCGVSRAHSRFWNQARLKKMFFTFTKTVYYESIDYLLIFPQTLTQLVQTSPCVDGNGYSV